MNQSAAPGPGSYDIRGRKVGPQWGFGTQQRKQLLNQSADPGPGTYDIPAKFADVPRYSMPQARR